MPGEEEPPREPQTPEPSWRMIVIWVVAVLLLLFVVYLVVMFFMESPQREQAPEEAEAVPAQQTLVRSEAATPFT